MNLLQVIVAGLVLGMGSSLHCIGMCGPLSLLLPVHHYSTTKRIAAIILYQMGRVITYMILGLMIGLAGRSFWLSGYQQILSIVAGSLVIFFAILYYIHRVRINIPIITSWYRFVQSLIMKTITAKTGLFNFLLMGAANGLLPCGMVYLAAIASMGLSELLQSVALMGAFGFGTMPAMMLVGFGGRWISVKHRLSIKNVMPFFVAVTGALLILRGLNLGIPFISPQAIPGSSVIICHP